MNAPLPHAGSALDIEISETLIRRFDNLGPRYTSYPTADRFTSDFDERSYRTYLGERAEAASNPPLSIYVHLPFCESLCYFCACNKIITRDHGRAAEYLRYLGREMDLVVPHLGRDRRTQQLHLGGGTPTFFSLAELAQLMDMLRGHFDFAPEAELGVEIDPRSVDGATLSALAALGFNRTSFGVQDFDPAVQQAVNRIQPLGMVEKALAASRDAGFQSVNVDLIYGLPRQSLASFNSTLDHIIRLSPDRIALYNYAHLPQRFKAQRLIVDSELPSAEERLGIFALSTRRLLEAGYVYIGPRSFCKAGRRTESRATKQELASQFPRLYHQGGMRSDRFWRIRYREGRQFLQPVDALSANVLSASGRRAIAR
ncbi:UNVERIFIED_ORG: oxygen-independent coproporphyrinogen III oxidase [Burkholderia sp. 1263]